MLLDDFYKEEFWVLRTGLTLDKSTTKGFAHGLLCLIAPRVNRPTSFTEVWDPWRPLEEKEWGWLRVLCLHRMSPFAMGSLEAM